MRYFPHTPDDISQMLAAVGAGSIDELFAAVPEAGRRRTPPNLPPPLTEWELIRHLEEMAARAGGDWRVFVGAGSQSHAIPAVVKHLASRSEFVTSYTPYQPEMSQGTLQAIFEFQTLVSRLFGLPVTNASLYDGATALAEAALMARRVTGRRAVAVSPLVHPHWREVLATYLAPFPEARLVTLPLLEGGVTDLSALSSLDGDDAPAALIIQSPNFWGAFENVAAAAERIHAAGGLLAVGISEPYALGLGKAPGGEGADIAFGEGQSFGLPQGFGGPGLGLLSCRAEYMRQIPGRLVGQTTDLEGRRGFVLTLSTREQHIRRGKAVSNICSNAGHCALTAAIHMGALGRGGLRAVARLNRDLAEYLKAGLERRGFRPLCAAPGFNEFALRAPSGFAARHKELQSRKVFAGLPLSPYYPEYPDAYLFGVTETKTRGELDDLLQAL